MNLLDTGSIATVRKRIAGQQPVIASIPLSRFKFGKNQSLTVDGSPLNVSEDAYYRFIKRVLNAPPGFIKRFKKITNEKTQLSMLETLLAGNVSKIQGKVIVVGDPSTTEITAFDKETNSFKTHEQAMDFVEQLLEVYPKLRFSGAGVGEDGVLYAQMRHKSSIDKIKGEDHLGGIILTNSYKTGCSLQYNLLRMVCTNGMTMSTQDKLSMNNSKQGMDTLFTRLDMLNKNNWIDPSFWKAVDRAMTHDASLDELLLARKELTKNSDIEQFNSNQLERFIPLNKVKNWLVKKGINYDKLTTEQLKNCPTGMKLWDLVNNMTDFASHDYGFEVKQIDRLTIQRVAGQLVSRVPDAMGFLHMN